MSPAHEKRLKELRDGAQKLLVADHFAALTVSRIASPEEINKAFVEAAKTWHPDRVPQGMDEIKPLFSKLFARLEVGRATLSDPARRLRYIEEITKPNVQATSGDLSAAEAALELRKAEVLLKKNDNAAATAHLRRAAQLAPANVEVRVLLVWLEAKPDATPARLRELLTELDRLLTSEVRSDRAFFFRGQLRKRLELLKEANDDFERAVALNAANVDAVREVRIFRMRHEKGARGPVHDADPAAGISGILKKFFGR